MTTERKSWKSAENVTWVLFGAATVAVYLFALDVPLLGPDEPRYAQVAREMYERGDWVTPTLGGFGWFEKPVLLYWLQIASYKIFGVSEFAARIGPALFGLGTVGTLFLLGKAVQRSENRVESSGLSVQRSSDDCSNGSRAKYEKQGNKDSEPRTLNPERAVLARWFALIAATSLGLLAFSRGASFDIIITFPITASLVGFYIFDQCSDDSRLTRRLSLATFYFFIGVGLIAKGLIGIVLPVSIVGFYHLLSRRWPEKELVISVFWGLALSASVAAVWYLPMTIRHGWVFIDEFFVQHHFQRYTSNKYSHPGPIWYFWAVLPGMTLPWLPFFLIAAWQYLRRSFFAKRALPGGDFVSANPNLLRFASAWLLVPLIFFSVSGSKLPGYILPALPPAVVFAGIYIKEFAAVNLRREAFVKIIAFAMMLTVSLILFFALPRFAESDSVKQMVRTADSQGFSSSKILNMHTISQNVEFYGAGRLVRDPNGKQWRFLGVPGVVEFMNQNGGRPVLVLIPHEYEESLRSSTLVKTKVLGRNAELTLVLVSLD